MEVKRLVANEAATYAPVMKYTSYSKYYISKIINSFLKQKDLNNQRQITTTSTKILGPSKNNRHISLKNLQKKYIRFKLGHTFIANNHLLNNH